VSGFVGQHVRRRQGRFCSHCKLNVYNLSAMTEAAGEALIRAREGKLCARIYRRRDGTVITRDCPLGWKAIRRKTLRLCVQTAAALLAIATATAYAIGPKEQRDKLAYLEGNRILVRRNLVRLPSAKDDDVFRRASFRLQRWLTEEYNFVRVAVAARSPLSHVHRSRNEACVTPVSQHPGIERQSVPSATQSHLAFR
jgi:hypothetical protein